MTVTPFDGYSLVWYRGEIVGAFESTPDNWAKQSIFASGKKKLWVCAAYNCFNDGPFDYVGFLDPQNRTVHDFYIIQVKYIPDFPGRSSKRINSEMCIYTHKIDWLP